VQTAKHTDDIKTLPTRQSIVQVVHFPKYWRPHPDNYQYVMTWLSCCAPVLHQSMTSLWRHTVHKVIPALQLRTHLFTI